MAVTTTTTLFSAPRLPHHHPLPKSRHPFSSLQSTTPLTHSPLIFVRASSSPSTVDKQEEEESPSSSEITSSTSTNPDSFTDQSQSIPIGGCKGCGKSEIERGCNGEGRIQGGIATVPGFGWWPIKAYRPCPGFVATGGRYRRQGQSMDEVAGFGTVPRSSAAAAATVTVAATDGAENKSSEKKEGPRKFKR